MNTQTANLIEVLEALPKTSKARRQFAMVERALEGLAELEDGGDPIDQTTAHAAVGLLRAATSRTKDILR